MQCFSYLAGSVLSREFTFGHQANRGLPMINPWLTSNPFVSLWLSSANQMMSLAHRLFAAEMQRQAAEMQAQWEKQVIDFWTGEWILQSKR